jgi:hypothetical protein
VPDDQSVYDPDIHFTYLIERTDSVSAEVNIGIEPLQVGILGVCICIVTIAVTCVIAKWVCKLGMPRYKPWEPNKDFYP